MRQIQLVIPGTPVPKARPRSHVIHTGEFWFNTKTGRQEEVLKKTTYTPEESAGFDALVRLAYYRECGEVPPTEDFVQLLIWVHLQAPKSMSKADRSLAWEEVLPHGKKPDEDNVKKAVKDGLSSVAYVDDKQVFHADVIKSYSLRPRVEVTVTILTKEEAVCHLLRLKQHFEKQSSPTTSPGDQRTSDAQSSLSL